MDTLITREHTRFRQARREVPMSRHIPYLRHVDAWTLQTRNDELVQVIQLGGISHETTAQDELNVLTTLRNAALRAIADPAVMLWHHIVRREVSARTSGGEASGFTRSLDTRWNARLASRRLFVNDLYLTVVRRPEAEGDPPLRRALRSISRRQPGSPGVAQRDQQRDLEHTVEQLLGALHRYQPRRLGLELGSRAVRSLVLEFVVALLTGQPRCMRLPRMNLSQYVATIRPFFGRDAIELRGPASSRWSAILSVKEYCPGTAPGMLDALLTLPAEAVVSQSFAFLSRSRALESLTRQQRILTTSEDPAISQVNEIDDALDDVAAGRYALGQHHLTVQIFSPELRGLSKAVSEVDRRLVELGLVAVRESEGAMELSYWAQLPGNLAYVPRPAPISSRNFAAFASFHNYPAGEPRGGPWGPPVTILETVSGTPYHFSFHVHDLGNTLVIGPSGSGKTVLMGFLLAQASRLAPRILFFDKDRGGDLFIRALGGSYATLQVGTPSGFSPFQLADSAISRAFLTSLLRSILTAHGEMLSAEEDLQIARAVENAYRLAPAERQLATIAAFFPRSGTKALEARLRGWWGDGELAWLFDHPQDLLRLDARIMGFDLTQLLDHPLARVPALLYLFHRADMALDGSPTILCIDEGWKALADPAFSPMIEDWQRTIRKRNGIVVFGSQSASSVLAAPMGSVIIEQSPTQLFLPNPKADRDSHVGGFHLTEREFQLIRTLPPDSRCFLLKQGVRSTVARLDLAGLEDEVSLLSGRSQSVRLGEEVRALHGDDPEAWIPRFHERRARA